MRQMAALTRKPNMKNTVSVLRSRAVWCLGLLAVAASQSGCAHPVWVQPQVAVQAQMGGPVYAPMPGGVYGSATVVMPPSPVWVPPSPVYVPPRVIVPAPVPMPMYRYGWGEGHHRHEHREGWGYGRGDEGHREHERGHGGWR